MIENMSFVEIIGLKELLPAVAELAQKRGVLHLKTVHVNREDCPASFLHRATLGDASKEEKNVLAEIDRTLHGIRAVTRRIGHTAEVATWVKTFSDSGPVEVFKHLRKAERQISGLLRKIGNVRDELASFAQNKPLLEFLNESLGANPEWRAEDVFGIVFPESKKSIEDRLGRDLESHVDRVAGQLTLPDGRDLVLVATQVEKLDTVINVLRRDGVKLLELAGHAHKPLFQAVRASIQRGEELPKALLEYNQQLDALVDKEGALVRAAELYSANRNALHSSVHHMAQTDFLFAIEGWLPTPELAPFRQALGESFGSKVYLGTPKPQGVSVKETPVALRNPPWLKPFEIFLGLFPAPVYGSLDPTLLIAIGFPLFFGFILGDVGYGVLVGCLAYWIRLRAKRLQNAMLSSASSVLMTCAASATIFGFLYGECFGDPSPIINPVNGLIRASFPALWAQRHGQFLHDLLWISVGAGFVHITLSLTLGAFVNFREGDSKHGYERLGMLLFLLGATALLTREALVGLGAPDQAIFVAGAGSLGLGLVILAAKVGITGLFESLSILANVVSYSRLMAIGVASIVLANLANEVLYTFPIKPLGILLAGLIHFCNLVLGILSPAIHSLRLHFVEFLPKFHKDGGVRYEPFAIQETAS